MLRRFRLLNLPMLPVRRDMAEVGRAADITSPDVGSPGNANLPIGEAQTRQSGDWRSRDSTHIVYAKGAPQPCGRPLREHSYLLHLQ